ncbi:MAG: hypothetical protein GX896_01215 [Clostridiales bacterium]|nr:hypothetical protein [Clostridiales bacterium]
MKIRLKKINRGIVLAIVLLIGLVVFVMVDNHNFKSEKAEIEKMTEDYVAGINDFNAAYYKEKFPNKKLTKEQEDKILSQGKEIFNKLWISGKPSGSTQWSSHKTDMMSTLDYHVKDNQFQQSIVQECNFNIKEMKVSKNGPNSALVDVTMNSKVIGSGDIIAFSPSGTDNMLYTEQPSDVEQLKLVKGEGLFTVELSRTDDGWKIKSVQGYFYELSSADITVE